MLRVTGDLDVTKRVVGDAKHDVRETKPALQRQVSFLGFVTNPPQLTYRPARRTTIYCFAGWIPKCRVYTGKEANVARRAGSS